MEWKPEPNVSALLSVLKGVLNNVAPPKLGCPKLGVVGEAMVPSSSSSTTRCIPGLLPAAGFDPSLPPKGLTPEANGADDILE